MSTGMAMLARRIGGFALLLSVCACTFAGEIRGISLGTGATGTRAEIQLAGAGQYKLITLSNPSRLVVDLPDASGRAGLKLPSPAGVVTGVRTGQPVPGTFRVVFDLATPVAALKPQLEGAGADARLVIEWPGDGAPAKATATAAALPAPAVPSASAAATSTPPVSSPDVAASARATAALAGAAARQAQSAAAPPADAGKAPAAADASPGPGQILAGAPTDVPVPAPDAAQLPQARPVGPYTVATGKPAVVAPASQADSADVPVPSPSVRMRAGMRPLVVAIDAGHGGQDSGAIGATGKYEKNVTLAVARELARQVDATPGMKAYLVRDGDYFIPLNDRARKARAAHADIFVSIHADAAENRSASGSTVYVLSLKGATSQRARWLADKENASDLVGGVRLQQVDNTLGSVLIDLAQSGHMRASEDAANLVMTQLSKIGDSHRPHIEKANFAVLRTSDMPAMLVETAYISNPTEERQLTDPSYQRKLASAILTGVQGYFTRQPPPGTLFAARAQAETVASSGTGAAGGGSP